MKELGRLAVTFVASYTFFKFNMSLNDGEPCVLRLTKQMTATTEDTSPV